MSRLRRTQLALFPAGDDLPLFVGEAPAVGAQEPAEELDRERPSEAPSLELFSIHETIDNVIG